VIDAATSKRADEVTEWINKSTDALSFTPVKSRRGPASAMTEWLVEGEGPSGFSIDRECVLQSPLEEKSTVRYTHHSLVDTDEIRNHITQAGKVPVQLALTWEDRVSFVLTDKLEIRRVSFLDIVRGDREADAESAEEQFASDFTLMTAMLGRFLSELLETLDGVEE
jgi:recombination associated protein RdgC